MNLSPEEAARALGEIEASRAAMRTAIRGYRGHYHLWLWGGIWVTVALLAEFHGPRISHWLALAGLATTILIFLWQKARIRSTGHYRFLVMLAAIIVFANIWPHVLGEPPNARFGFAYNALVAMFCFVVAGIWFTSYLLWIGLGVSALILAGLFFFPAFFWWSVVLCGGTLIGTGFYVRFFWR